MSVYDRYQQQSIFFLSSIATKEVPKENYKKASENYCLYATWWHASQKTHILEKKRRGSKRKIPRKQLMMLMKLSHYFFAFIRMLTEEKNTTLLFSFFCVYVYIHSIWPDARWLFFPKLFLSFLWDNVSKKNDWWYDFLWINYNSTRRISSAAVFSLF